MARKFVPCPFNARAGKFKENWVEGSMKDTLVAMQG
jgi:hypothetical protein